MPRFDKWLTAVGPRDPLVRAARKALVSRLAAVEHFLGQAAQVSGRPDEAVHQLRIWTRRAAAVLRLFRDLLPRRRAKWLRRKLRELRRVAGRARDADVLGQQLERTDVPALATTAVHLRKQRRKDERKLAKLHKSLVRSGKLARTDRRLRDKARWSGKRAAPRFGPWCREQLRPLCDEFFRLGEADLARDEAVHELRLAGKWLRYALELAPAAIPAATRRRLYDELCDLQNRLGTLCDLVAAAERMHAWLDEAKDAGARRELDAALSRQQKQLAMSRRRLLRWWTRRRREQMRRAWAKAVGR